MFVDELILRAKAGNGGDGVVRWLRERHRPLGGPAGGDGGDGGDVYMRAVRDANTLAKYTGEKLFRAQDGEAGGGRSRAGHRGSDCVIDVPIGSKVTDLSHEKSYLFDTEGQTVKVLHGGKGGLGNERFKSSINRSPKESTKGTKGEDAKLRVEVSLIADVGLVGLPNAGKSTLLNALTNASSAVGAYPFTTTEPHLGDLFGYILADIPGLIEGASGGKGLGHKFLRHIGRTRMLLHCISLEHAVEGKHQLLKLHQVVQNELTQFDPELGKKEEWIILTKRDVVPESYVADSIKAFSRISGHVYAISAETGEGVKEFRDALTGYLRSIAGRTSAESSS